MHGINGFARLYHPEDSITVVSQGARPTQRLGVRAWFTKPTPPVEHTGMAKGETLFDVEVYEFGAVTILRNDATLIDVSPTGT